MGQQSQSGILLLADISGFTSYVAQTELAHSQEILAELLELIVRHTKPVLTLSKLEGDAVFAYSTDQPKLSGERLLEAVESTYVAFRGRVEGIRQRTTCTCAACSMIPMLDLKFMVHHGEFMFQSISGARELVGSDVNLVHRLAKNHIFEETGWNAYALYTEIALKQMEISSEGLHPLVETYEHLGDIQTYSSDLRTRYKEIIAMRRLFIEADQAHGAFSFKVAASPVIAWDFLTNPEKRSAWGTDPWFADLRPGGRTGVGASNHCAHGNGSTSHETLVDWQPFEYYTALGQSRLDREHWLDAYHCVIFEPQDDGQSTRIVYRLKMVKPTLFNRLAAKAMAIMLPGFFNRMSRYVKDWLAAEQGMGAAVPTPTT